MKTWLRNALVRDHAITWYLCFYPGIAAISGSCRAVRGGTFATQSMMIFTCFVGYNTFLERYHTTIFFLCDMWNTWLGGGFASSGWFPWRVLSQARYTLIGGGLSIWWNCTQTSNNYKYKPQYTWSSGEFMTKGEGISQSVVMAIKSIVIP